MSEVKIQDNQYWDNKGVLQVKGEKHGTCKINKVNVPFYNIYVCNMSEEDKNLRPTVRVTVKRNVNNRDEKTNVVTKELDKISNLTHSAEVLVRLRRQLEQEIYAQNNPSCAQLKNVYDRLSNFATCLEGTARDDFIQIMDKCQLATLEQFEKEEKSLTQSILFYERMVWHKVNLLSFKDVIQALSDYETYLTQQIEKNPSMANEGLYEQGSIYVWSKKKYVYISHHWWRRTSSCQPCNSRL